ncbi:MULTISPECIES: hypothetical protein [unclassified Thioalkalivibrio]|uniref:hypothetical protein n=1 Tax=unclassified Thioalkalivibrio TaxID=2621013 RepID=UPI0003760C11|nr:MULTISPECIES: hypothetical protein [unclassified Thioalkalivibrio]
MSTSAIYNIDGQYFYTHWDGYPEGAAVRLFNMIHELTQPARDGLDEVRDARGGLGFAFVRGNLDAEPHPGSYDTWGAEYLYSVKTGAGPAQVVIAPRGRTEGVWLSQEPLPLVDWLVSLGHPVCECEYAPYFGTVYRLATRENAGACAAAAAARAERYGPENPNRAGFAAKARAWAVAAGIDVPEVAAVA